MGKRAGDYATGSPVTSFPFSLARVDKLLDDFTPVSERNDFDFGEAWLRKRRE